MTGPSDGKEFLDRSRLCDLGEIQRGRHVRWTSGPNPMLREKRRYGELDLIRAVILDEVNRRLKPKATKSVWPQVETEIDHPGQRLEVVVALSTLDASVARSHSELDVVLPRDEATMVIDLEPRVRRARERLARFRARLGNNEHAHLSSAREQEARTVIEPSAGQS